MITFINIKNIVLASALALVLVFVSTTAVVSAWYDEGDMCADCAFDSDYGGWDSYNSDNGSWDSFNSDYGGWDSYNSDNGSWDSFDSDYGSFGWTEIEYLGREYMPYTEIEYLGRKYTTPTYYSTPRYYSQPARHIASVSPVIINNKNVNKNTQTQYQYNVQTVPPTQTPVIIQPPVVQPRIVRQPIQPIQPIQVVQQPHVVVQPKVIQQPPVVHVPTVVAPRQVITNPNVTESTSVVAGVHLAQIPYTGVNELAYILTLIAVALTAGVAVILNRGALVSMFGALVATTSRDDSEPTILHESIVDEGDHGTDEGDEEEQEDDIPSGDTLKLITDDDDGPRLKFTRT